MLDDLLISEGKIYWKFGSVQVFAKRLSSTMQSQT